MHGKSQTDLSDDLDIPLTTISSWVHGNSYPRIEKLAKLAQYFGVSVTDIIGQSAKGESPSTQVAVYSSVHWDGGKLVMKVLNLLEELPARMIKNGKYFGLKLDNDEMSPKLDEGDILIVQETSTVYSGDLVVAAIANDQAIVRKIKHTEFGISLHPFNPNSESLFFSHDEIRKLPILIIGKVVEVRRKF